MFFGEMWYLDLFGSGESKSIVLDPSYVSEFKKKHEEYLALNSLSEKLRFYDDNRHLFEFPYNEFVMKDYFSTQYTFNFKPAPHFLETIIYNPWFVERSKEYLTHMGHRIGIPFHSSEQLWESFIETKDRLPILKKYIKREKKRLKAICEECSPGRFDYWYEYKVLDVKALAPRYELTKQDWNELFIKEVIDYIIKLEKYQADKDTIPEDLTTAAPLNNSKKSKSTKRIKADTTFLGLFRENKEIMNGFIEVLKSRGYLTEDEKWNFIDFDKGELLAIIKHLESTGIIRKLKYKAELGRVFNSRFGEILSIRSYQAEPKFEIDPSLGDALTALKVPPK